MSLYKNLGPITFHSETQAAQIFITERYWLVQSKFLNSISDSTKHLSEISRNYNKYFEKNILQVYCEGSKFPCLIMNRNQVGPYDLASDNSIELLCAVCRILIKSFQAAQIEEGNLQIEPGMFFKFNDNDQGFYLHISKAANNSSQAGSKLLCNSILNFLETDFSISHISNKLLITKLKRCSTLKEMKEQLQYFQKVYQIGVKKVQKQIKESQVLANILTEQNYDKKKVNHRRYRKRSEEIHEEQANSPHYSIPLPKRHSSSESRENSSKNRQFLVKNSQSLHESHNRSTKISLFSNRNKPARGQHSSSTNPSRFQMMGSFGFSKELSKGIFLKSKQTTKELKSKKLNAYSVNSLQLSKTTQNINNFTSTNNISTHSVNKFGYASSTTKNNLKKEKHEKILSKHYDDFISAQKEVKQFQDEKALKQIMASTLNVCKEKKNKRESLASNNKLSYHEQSSKSLKRKSKNQRQSMKLIDQGWIQKLIQKPDEKLSQNLMIKKSTKYSQEHKTHQIPKNTHLDSIEKHKNQENILFQEIQQIKLQNQDTIRPQKQLPKKKVQIEQVQYNQTKMSSRNSQIKSQNSEAKSTLKQKQEEKQKQQKQNQKEKTTRKKKNANVNEILENTLLKNIKSQIEKINYVGECVTTMPTHIQSLCDGEGDKYLWQLPAFILYKEFYIRRIQIEEKLKEELHSYKSPRQELVDLLKDLQQQNAETKQSLTKLLKVTLKKLKKYQVDPRTVEQTKNFLNLDLTIRWTNRVNQIIYNFIVQLEQLRQKKSNVLTILIELCDAYCICNGGEFHVEQRKKIRLSHYESQETIRYFDQKMQVINT